MKSIKGCKTEEWQEILRLTRIPDWHKDEGIVRRCQALSERVEALQNYQKLDYIADYKFKKYDYVITYLNNDYHFDSAKKAAEFLTANGVQASKASVLLCVYGESKKLNKLGVKVNRKLVKEY